MNKILKHIRHFLNDRAMFIRTVVILPLVFILADSGRGVIVFDPYPLWAMGWFITVYMLYMTVLYFSMHIAREIINLVK